jgi:hypothetical protein
MRLLARIAVAFVLTMGAAQVQDGCCSSYSPPTCPDASKHGDAKPEPCTLP